MALSGTIADWSFADILQVISAQRKSGSLRLEYGDEVVTLTVCDGKIVDAERKQPARGSAFLRFLVDTGRTTPAGARKVLELMKNAAADPVSAVLDAGLIEPKHLDVAFHDYVQELVYLILQWQEGDYEFVAHSVTPAHPHLSSGTEGLLIEGMRRIDEWVRITRIVGADTVFRLIAGVQVPRDLPRRERALLRLVDGVQDVTALTKTAPLTEYEVGEALMNLHSWGIVEIAKEGVAHMEVIDLAPEDLESAPRFRRVLNVASLGILVLASILFGLVSNGAEWALPRDQNRERDRQVLIFALETYRAEFGAYPESLARLAAAGIEVDATARDFVYRMHEGREEYTLIAAPVQQTWHGRILRQIIR